LTARDEHDRHEAAARAQLLREVDARHPRQVLIEQQAVELAREHLLGCLGRVARFVDVGDEPALFDSATDRQPVDQVAVDHEEAEALRHL
jgi:hypothetical protein